MLVHNENIKNISGHTCLSAFLHSGRALYVPDTFFMEKEIWKDIPGYEGIYRISSYGRIKRLAREIQHPHFGVFQLRERMLKCKENHFGYPLVGLTKPGEKFIARPVHRLMMLAFNGDSDLLVDHINGVRNDNRLENLRYCTRLENNTFPNVKKFKNTKYIGIKKLKRSKKWAAKIQFNNVVYTLGTFDLQEDAHNAYILKKNELLNKFTVK